MWADFPTVKLALLLKLIKEIHISCVEINIHIKEMDLCGLYNISIDGHVISRIVLKKKAPSFKTCSQKQQT